MGATLRTYAESNINENEEDAQDVIYSTYPFSAGLLGAAQDNGTQNGMNLYVELSILTYNDCNR